MQRADETLRSAPRSDWSLKARWDYHVNRARTFNETRGEMNIRDGINCPACKNKGIIMQVFYANGMICEGAYKCKCMEMRKSVANMLQSGLESTIRRQRFDNFSAAEPWQEALLERAREYAAQGIAAGDWFFVGGKSGAGKTHICTAICREALLGGKRAYYMIWPTEAQRLKAQINDPWYQEQIMKLRTVDVLYIDDFLKPAFGGEDAAGRPTAADIRVAYEIINQRYIRRLPTIISSEWFIGELVDIDAAVGGRIYERTGQDRYALTLDNATNYRLGGVR